VIASSTAKSTAKSAAAGITAVVSALLALCWLAFFNGLGDLGLMDKTEALFVEVGHQMLLSGDWVTPRWNGAPSSTTPCGATGWWP
jgi:4-amino-4-deoxy-L-arabinose transferase-like glycosyltransferase